MEALTIEAKLSAIAGCNICRSEPNTMDVDALHILAVLAKELPDGKTIVEVGGLFGCSATNFALNTPKTTKIHTIDPWQHEAWIEQFTNQKLSKSAFVDFLRKNDVLDRIEPIKVMPLRLGLARRLICF